MDFESTLNYKYLAWIVLVVFYGIYFIKMIAQRRKGIQTHQIGRTKEKTVHIVESVMSVATLAVVIMQVVSIITEWNGMPANARFTGFCVAMIGNLIFLISVYTMRDSWRAGIPDQDQTEFVTTGIYRYSRNPAFLGFDLMYIGVLLMFFNWGMLILTLFAMVSLHLQMLQEEKFLEKRFGAKYIAYKKHTFRYLGCRNEKRRDS